MTKPAAWFDLDSNQLFWNLANPSPSKPHFSLYYHASYERPPNAIDLYAGSDVGPTCNAQESYLMWVHPSAFKVTFANGEPTNWKNPAPDASAPMVPTSRAVGSNDRCIFHCAQPCQHTMPSLVFPFPQAGTFTAFSPGWEQVIGDEMTDLAAAQLLGQMPTPPMNDGAAIHDWATEVAKKAFKLGLKYAKGVGNAEGSNAGVSSDHSTSSGEDSST